MEQAFDVCLHDYQACPIYRRLVREQEREYTGFTTRLTVEGRRLSAIHPDEEPAIPLRATGT